MLTRLGEEAGVPAPASPWSSILTDASGSVWIRSEQRLLELKRGAARFEERDVGLPPADRDYFLSLDTSGNVLVPSPQGLGHWDGAHWRFVGYKSGLPGETVRSALADREGSLWIGLMGTGLARWRGPGRWESYGRLEGFRSEEVWAIQRDRLGQVWVGTTAGLEKLFPAHQRGTPDSAKSVHVGAGYISSLTQDSDGKLWAGVYPGGVLRIEPGSGGIEKFGRASGLATRGVLSVLADRSGTVWAGTVEGLFRADHLKRSIRFRRIAVPGGTDQEWFRGLCQDAQGRIWAAGGNGLARFENGQWTRFTTKEGLLGNWVEGVAASASGDIWVYYNLGLGVSRLRFGANDALQVIHFDRSNGLRSEGVYLVGIDREDRVWVGGDQGLDRFDGQRWAHLNRTQGLVWDDCDQNAFFADSDGGVWIGTSKGVAHYKAPKALPNPPPPKVVITAAHWGHHSLPDFTSNSFAYESDALTISFAALTFTNSAAVRFRYRLEGLETDWVETAQREVRFAVLPPGSYRFAVIARSAEGVWSDTPASFSLRIQPPFWMTWWFSLLCACACALCGWRIWRWRLRVLMLRQTELERIVEERTKELQELASKDALTKLWNRRMIFEILSNELRSLNAKVGFVSVVMVDLDGFKKINDRHGHHAGDLVLLHAASLLKACLRHTDEIGRYGGEEFLVVLRDCSGQAAIVRAEQLRNSLESAPLALSNGALRVTASFGVNWSSEPLTDLQELISGADQALYRAKKAGRNRVETFCPEPSVSQELTSILN